MVITKLYGGLGNQMYQYAAGVALAERLGTKHYLDLKWFEEVKKDPELTLRRYELDGFGIKPRAIGVKENISLKLNLPIIFKETSFSYLKGYEELSGNVILDGYWQSYKYFEKYNEIIIREFKFPDRPKIHNKKLMDEMKSSESVLIHVRRGDYTKKRAKEFHGLIHKSYYDKAISLLSKRLSRPLKLFVFSDDIDWCKKNMKFDHPTVYEDSNSSNTGPEDMQLMSTCKSMIIANSSFSWWAAWLNPNKDKIVYAPQAWFKGAEHEINDRIPANWIKI